MHLSEEKLVGFQRNTLSEEAYIEVLEHLAACTYCAEQFTNLLDEKDVVKAPNYMKEKILLRTQQPDIQAVIQMKKVSKKMQFWMYTAKTAAAVLGALLLLLIIPVVGDGAYMKTDVSKQHKQNVGELFVEGTNHIASYIYEFSNKIVNGGIKK